MIAENNADSSSLQNPTGNVAHRGDVLHGARPQKVSGPIGIPEIGDERQTLICEEQVCGWCNNSAQGPSYRARRTDERGT